MTERKQAEENARRLLQEEVARQAAEAGAQAAKRAQQEERRQREQLRVTLSSIGDAVIVTDTRGVVTFLNPVAAELTGWGPREAAGKPLEQVFRIVNEETGQPVESPVGKVLREDGSRVDVSLTISPVLSAEGKVVAASKIARDITVRKRYEQALKEADRQKNEWIAMLAHELRNPLAPIRNALHLLKVPGADAGAVEQIRQMAERQVQHVVRLVDDLLDVSRILRGRIALRKESVELAHVVARGAETAQPMIDAQGQQLITALPPEPLRLEGDPTRLAQVVSNLLHNAAKFSARAGRIWLTVERLGDTAVLRVRDEGAGIPADLLPRVFDLFTQEDRSLERSQGGLGIGLTVVRKLVELHGGTVTAHSEGPGKGSEFVVRLPGILEARSPGPAEAGPAPGPAPVARRVLVVDDNVDAAESVAMILRLSGHEIRLAHSGPEALKAAEKYRPEVVVLDIGLPGISGYEVAKRLRQQPTFRETLLIAVTGYGQEEDQRRSREAGFDRHLVKPVDPYALEQVLATLK
jgi:PAS domain S-box-containing protein